METPKLKFKKGDYVKITSVRAELARRFVGEIGIIDAYYRNIDNVFTILVRTANGEPIYVDDDAIVTPTKEEIMLFKLSN